MRWIKYTKNLVYQIFNSQVTLELRNPLDDCLNMLFSTNHQADFQILKLIWELKDWWIRVLQSYI